MCTSVSSQVAPPTRASVAPVAQVLMAGPSLAVAQQQQQQQQPPPPLGASSSSAPAFVQQPPPQMMQIQQQSLNMPPLPMQMQMPMQMPMGQSTAQLAQPLLQAPMSVPMMQQAGVVPAGVFSAASMPAVMQAGFPAAASAAGLAVVAPSLAVAGGAQSGETLQRELDQRKKERKSLLAKQRNVCLDYSLTQYLVVFVHS